MSVLIVLRSPIADEAASANNSYSFGRDRYHGVRKVWIEEICIIDI
jgi:hypothetical protein